jgi:3-oxoacyl-[acyl-carrier-protein] synthase-3
MKLPAVAIKAVAAALPAQVRTNEYFREHYRETVAQVQAQTLATPWSSEHSTPTTRLFDETMTPYLRDPFRGAVERRILAPGEKLLDLERSAACQVLDGVGAAPGEVDLLIACSFMPDQPAVGNAAFLAKELGLRGASWNLESACAGALVALQTAAGLIRSGTYRNALVVASCSYSRLIEDSSVLSWTAGDGAGAFFLSAAAEGEGFLGGHAVNTGGTCGMFFAEMVVDPATARPRYRMGSSRDAGQIARETAEPFARLCCDAALAKAGLAAGDVDVLVTNTPMAWNAEFVARVLGIDPAKSIDGFPLHANIGPALSPVNLHLAASSGRIRHGDIVLMYAFGGASSAAAVVMRWGETWAGSGLSSDRFVVSCT